MNGTEVLKVIDPGLGATVQDQGRPGWRRFGVPASGPMDDHAAAWANRLLDNPPEAPVLELLLQGAKLAVLADFWIAITGADAQSNLPMWRACHAKTGQIIQFPRERSGVWIYLAVEGGIVAERFLGSASVYPRGEIGKAVARGEILHRRCGSSFKPVPAVASRSVAWGERRNYDAPPALKVWPGPQFDLFSQADRERFFSQEWVVTAQSDRVGYRLAGPRLGSEESQIMSEPVRVGTVQVPASGQPIVMMRDGPTVGGYPKIGMIDPGDLAWLGQCRPGTKVRFHMTGDLREHCR
ncbi:MAG: biotin-dependent carboxyltransferase [Verrucomicrobia bacterium]|nr:biotin-dependent carboxyltransferase [Verrucomicrobiota bacterium]